MKAGDKTFYDGYWKGQVALSCDEKCRLRFIVSEVDTVARREARAAVDLGARLRVAGRKPRLRIADVGCGRGWLTEVLSHFGEAVGFDQSTVEAARRYPRLTFIERDVLDLEQAPAPRAHDAHSKRDRLESAGRERPGPHEQDVPGDFDVAVCSEVVEHIRREDQPKLAESISSILRQEGTLILTTPNRPVVARVVEKLGLQNELQPVEDWLDAEALSRLLNPRFEVLKLTTLMFFPAWMRRIGPTSRAYRTFYETWGGHRAVDPVLGPTLRGLYLGAVARKRATSPSPAAGASDGEATAGGRAPTNGAR